MAECSECGQKFADKANEAKCKCSCHSPIPSLPRREYVPSPVGGGFFRDGYDLSLRGLLEYGG